MGSITGREGQVRENRSERTRKEREQWEVTVREAVNKPITQNPFHVEIVKASLPTQRPLALTWKQTKGKRRERKDGVQV